MPSPNGCVVDCGGRAGADRFAGSEVTIWALSSVLVQPFPSRWKPATLSHRGELIMTAHLLDQPEGTLACLTNTKIFDDEAAPEARNLEFIRLLVGKALDVYEVEVHPPTATGGATIIVGDDVLPG